jgi:hypothetical protein
MYPVQKYVISGCRVFSKPSFDTFFEISILITKFLFKDDFFSLDKDVPEYNVD